MNESRAITTRQPAGGVALIGSLEDAARMAKFVAESKLFSCNNAAEAMVKIVAGLEMGFPAIASMTDIHIIEGKPSVGAHLMAAAIRRSGKYDYKIREHTDEVCTIAFFQVVGGKMEEQGVVTTTMKQARENGWNVTRKGEEKPTWKTKPKNMLFARTISDGYKFYCPDLTGGMLVYDRDEIEPEPPAPSVKVVNHGNGAGQSGPAQIEHRGESAIDDVDLTVNSDGSLRNSLDDRTEGCHRIEALLRELGFTSEQLKKKLERDFGGADSIYKLDLAAVQSLESQLLAVRAKRQQNTSASSK